MDKSSLKRRLEKMEQFVDVSVAPPDKRLKTPESDLADLVDRLGVQSKHAHTDLTQLKDAGWSFSVGKRSTEENDFELVRDIDGHLKLAGRALTIKFQPELDRSEIDAFFERHSVKVRREFPFSKNTFLVDVGDEKVLEKAKALNELEQVLYAEPNLVEPITSRR